VNTAMKGLFEQQDPGMLDRRRNYQLVGAIWLDKPESFKTNQLFQNQPGQSTDDPGAIVAGEDALSSTAMESFTQVEKPNCFSCHNTKRVTSDIPPNPTILQPKKLNVSHVLSKFVAEKK
jgi:hypothetical protein